MMLKFDHFTPLQRAVASIDRDSYAARFAVYDREHKALLRRLAAAETPVSDADVAREEQAFRDAIRRIEFADEDDQLTLVPPDQPAGEALPELPRAPIWPQPRPARRESLDVSNLPSLDQLDPTMVEPIIRLSEHRSIARRVGERLALAAVALAVAGVGLWMVEGRRGAATAPSSLRGAVESTEPAPADNAADPKALQPTWLSPEMFYAPPPPPAAPRADVPLPVPRPER
jgi:hypothetical protein